jgi:branched-chain amino acid transport system ATP-binding protein
MSMLSVEGATSSYGRIAVLRDISLNVAAGELVALVGSNGAGKTTLLRAISGVQPIGSGAIIFDGKPIHALSPHARVRAGIVQVPEGRQVFSPLSVEDNLRLGAWSRKDSEIATDIQGVYATFPVLAEKRGIAAGSLSGGQQQMLALAMSFVMRPRVLLVDELSLGLAPVVVQELLEVVERLKAAGQTMIIVEQSLNVALAVADRAVFMEKGRVRFEGDAQELAERDDLVRAVFLGAEGG